MSGKTPGFSELVPYLTAKQSTLEAALKKCDPTDEQHPTALLKQILDRISRTLAVLQDKTNSVPRLSKYRFRVSVPRTSAKYPAHINIRLDQKKTSKPLDLNEFFVIKPPLGPVLTTARVASRYCCVNYTHEFDLPDRSPQSIALAKASDVEFCIWRYTAQSEIAIGKGKIDLLAKAKAPLMPLCFAATASCPLEFKTADGDKTEYAFEVVLTTAEPLIPEAGALLDEQLILLKEDVEVVETAEEGNACSE
jgi:hypothetical protein